MAAENWMINVLEKLKELGMQLASFGGSLVSKAYNLFPPQKVQQWIQGAVPSVKAKAREIGAENSINFLLEKLKELRLVVENYGGIWITKVDGMFRVLKNRVEELQIWFHVEMLPVLKNRVEELQIWFQVAKPYIVPVAVLLLCFYFLSRFCGGGGGGLGKMMMAGGGVLGKMMMVGGGVLGKMMMAGGGVLGKMMMAGGEGLGKMMMAGGEGLGKMMKAPGRDIRIPRAPFEKNPRAYFRDLRGKID